MRKSTATEIVARRLGVARGRADSLVQRAAEDNLLPTTEGSRRYPPDLAPAELANLFLTVAVDNGLAMAGDTVRQMAGLANHDGQTFGDALTALLAHGPALQGAVPGSLVIRLNPASVALTLGGIHARYGPEPPPDSAGKHVVVPGGTLAAIGLEFCGKSRDEADALVALARATRSLNLALAFEA